jgi:hypothetical protein
MAVLRPAQAAMVAAAVSREYHVLGADIPVEAFPLFLSGRQYLAMLDATLPPADMFFRCGCCVSDTLSCRQPCIILLVDILFQGCDAGCTVGTVIRQRKRSGWHLAYTVRHPVYTVPCLCAHDSADSLCWLLSAV